MGLDLDFRCKVPKVLKSVKYTLAAVNGVFLLTGLLLFIVGLKALLVFSEYDALITRRFFNVSGFVVATGVIILLGTGLGFYSAISQQFYFVAGYVVLLLVILVFEISIIIAAFSLSNDAARIIRTPMLQTLQQYGTMEINKLWDDLQMEFKCCGVAGRFDWITTQIPISCCFIDYGTISPFECTTANAYEFGCASVLGESLSYNAYVIAVSAVVATCLQVLLSLMGGYLAYRSKFEEVELES